ncbi:nitrogen regulatory protein P-II homolog isoform X1 [Punica granatum]|uniref:Nitrogen regulatory protein P-II homolog isoform X1 n=1 Tax=Punica granatum TaxID=22663 RepID=A0A6P8E795_PUNGR|nr:nitrogen regulatory protein P-II homolog isoform X1 [Punica granatum]
MAASSAMAASPGTLRPFHLPSRELPLVDSAASVLFNPQLSRRSGAILRCRNRRHSPVLPVIRAQRSPDYLPDARFYKVEAILRPWRVSQVSSPKVLIFCLLIWVFKALLEMGIRGVTVSDVRGFGAQGGSTERQGGSEFSEDKFLAKVKMEIVVNKDQVEAVIGKIIEEARTGEIGDGKIFVVPVADVIRVRTGERGENAERMSGGRSDMSSAS